MSTAAAAAVTGESVAARQKKKKKPKPKPKHVEVGVAQSQSPHVSAPFLQTPTQSPAPGTPILQEAAAMRKEKKIRNGQKAAMLFLPPKPNLEEGAGMATTKKQQRRKEIMHSSPCASAAKTPILEPEVKVTKKKRKRRMEQEQEPWGNSPLPLHPGHAFLQSPAPEILTLAEAAAMIRKRNRRKELPFAQNHTLEEGQGEKKKKMRKEQKVDALPFAQNPTFEVEEHGDEAMMATKKKKKCKCVQQILSSSISVAAETPIQEQEVKVTKKQNQRRWLEPSSNLPLPLHPGHVSEPLLAAPFFQSPAPEILMLGELGAAVTIGKRKMRKEQKVDALSFAQNPTLEEEQGEERKRVEQILSSPASIVAETPVQEQEVKVTKKQKQRRATLPLDPGQSCCVQSQGAKTPPEQEGENDGCKGIKKSNGKKPRVRVFSNRELIQEARKQPKPLPEGFVPFSNFVASCTEQNPDQSPYSAFFDQFRYNPVCKVRKPPLPRTPDHVARLPPQGYSSFESSQLAANEASRPDTTLASKTKQQDSGSGSQEKVSVQVKGNPENKTREKKQRKLSGKSRLPIDPSQTCCVQLQGTEALPEQDQKTSKAFKANNSVESKSKKKDSASGSTSGSQKKQNVKEKTTPEKKTRISKPRSVLTAAEKRSDKYRRVPLDQLVSPPRSPHNLLQEKYASDPWKVILICVFLNLTQGIQVRRMLEGFFERYPDPWSAINADPDKMAEYLAPLGLQHVRTRNIKKLSKQYVGNEWTHVTQLCGVGKYAADAYAIFCAGRAREVVPDDHKLDDYWNYVCFELPMAQAVLVNNNTTEKTMVQYVIGNSAPVIICSIDPGYLEMCHLGLEYEENHEVHFSVLGASSVHLSGYYPRDCNCPIRYPDSSESHGEDVGGEYGSDRETSESQGEDVGGEYGSDRETSESHRGDAGEYNSDWEYHHVSEAVSKDCSESDILDDGDVEIPDDDGASESMDDGDMYSTPDRKQEKHQVDSHDDNIDSSSYKPAVSQMFNSGKVSDEIELAKVTSNDETGKELNGSQKRKSDAINQDLASPVKVTEINGSSIPEPEPENKSPLEPEYGKHSKNTRTFKDMLIIEDMSAGNKDA